jgi:hypothetical protein
MGEPEKSDYYISRKGRLMRDFDQVVKRVAPVFATRYGRAEAAALATDARHEFEAILPDLPYIGGAQPHTQLVVIGGWFLAMTRALGRHGRPVVEAGELVFQFSEHYLRVVPGFARHFLGSVSFSPRYLRKLRQRAAESQKRQFPGGYVFTYVEGDGTRFDYGVDYTECATSKFLSAQGAAELAPYLCAVDILYSDALGWGLQRTMTIAEGNPVCDFRFKRGAKTAVASSVLRRGAGS